MLLLPSLQTLLYDSLCQRPKGYCQYSLPLPSWRSISDVLGLPKFWGFNLFTQPIDQELPSSQAVTSINAPRSLNSSSSQAHRHTCRSIKGNTRLSFAFSATPVEQPPALWHTEASLVNSPLEAPCAFVICLCGGKSQLTFLLLTFFVILLVTLHLAETSSYSAVVM